MQFNVQTMLYSDLLIPYEQKIYETKPDIGEEESLELASMLYFDSLKLELKINNDDVLTQSTIDRLALMFLNRFFDREIGFETERKFKMKLKSVLNTKSDYYSKKFSIYFNNFLKENVSIKKSYERGRNSTVNTVNEVTGTGSSENKNNVTSNTNNNNFTRDIIENTPDERLNLTSNASDGSGVINKASQIQEHKTTNKQDSTGNETGTASYNSKDNLNSDTTGNETENYDDSTTGYDFRNVSQGKVYQDFLNSLQNVFDEILDDCDKCFMQIWI